jgi:hypothetical protein
METITGQLPERSVMKVENIEKPPLAAKALHYDQLFVEPQKLIPFKTRLNS